MARFATNVTIRNTVSLFGVHGNKIWVDLVIKSFGFYEKSTFQPVFLFHSLCYFFCVRTKYIFFIRFKIGVPDVLLAKHEDKNGGYCFPVTINAIPAPIFVQWSIKDKNSVSFEAIDVNDEKYSGTSNSLPSPVLVVKQTDELETCFFQIEVQNFIGSSKSIIPGKKALCPP